MAATNVELLRLGLRIRALKKILGRSQKDFAERVIWLSDDIEADRVHVVHQVPDSKIRTARVLSNGRIPEELEIYFG